MISCFQIISAKLCNMHFSCFPCMPLVTSTSLQSAQSDHPYAWQTECETVYLLSFGDSCCPFPISPNVLSCTLILVYPPSLLYVGEYSHEYRTATKLMVLTVWCWMLCICNTQRAVQNTERHINISPLMQPTYAGGI